MKVSYFWQAIKISFRNFPGAPVVKTSPSNTEVVGLIPGAGARIPPALGPQTKTKNRSNIVLLTSSMKIF